MIGFFPEPYPDELLFSICSRYAESSGYQTPTAAARDLFASSRFQISADLPVRLRTLVNALPPGHHLTVERLISEHSLLPLFAPFVSVQRIKTAMDRMEGSGGGAAHGTLGVNTFKGKLKVFRYCPSCVEADRATYGKLTGTAFITSQG